MTTPASEARDLFETVWRRLVDELGADALRFPGLIVWLGGAPGAGKGTNAGFIMRELGIEAEPVVMSSLLDTPEMRAIKDSGALVQDADVVHVLFTTLLDPAYRKGAIVDGYPRTAVQVECIRCLRDRMSERHAANPDFPEPDFHACVLHVTKQTAIERQLARGRKVQEHNRRVRETGEGELREERATDMDPDKIAKRYDVFCQQTLAALESMKDDFSYHFIEADGDFAEVEANVVASFRR